MTTNFRIAGVQMDIRIGEPEHNLQRMIEAVRETSRSQATLAVFPECALTGYCFESLAEARPFAESIPGPATDRLGQIAKELGVYVVFGLLEVDHSRVFNACALVGPDGVVGTYRKVHLPFLGVDRFTTPGDRAFSVLDAGGLRIGMNICYDAAFPEASRVLALQGADLIVLPTNWPPGAECTADFVLNTRALENAVYTMAVDRVGEERGFPFIGKSRICDTSGNTIASADHANPAIIYANIDVTKARNKKIVRVPHKHVINRFADRRPDLYGPIVAPVTEGGRCAP